MWQLSIENRVSPQEKLGIARRDEMSFPKQYNILNIFSQKSSKFDPVVAPWIPVGDSWDITLEVLLIQKIAKCMMIHSQVVQVQRPLLKNHGLDNSLGSYSDFNLHHMAFILLFLFTIIIINAIFNALTFVSTQTASPKAFSLFLN